MKRKFKCEIDCANCAAKVEDAIRKIDGVHDVKVNFMMQKMTLDADDSRFEAILKEAIETGRKIEPDFSVEV
ncbi:MAG: cation transporter [Lachnospiraceae bacterium]|nr:cation transporter [Lachnospiraceae bacterium]